jgi:hypothetical protein
LGLIGTADATKALLTAYNEETDATTKGFFEEALSFCAAYSILGEPGASEKPPVAGLDRLIGKTDGEDTLSDWVRDNLIRRIDMRRQDAMAALDKASGSPEIKIAKTAVMLKKLFVVQEVKLPPSDITEVNTVTAVTPAVDPNVKAESVSPAVDNNAVVLTVNGIKITEGRIDKMLAPKMKQAAGRVPENMVSQYRQKMRKQVIEILIIESVLAERGKEMNITVSEAELADQINKQLAEQNTNIDEFKLLLRGYGVDYADYQENMRKRIVFEKLMEIEFADKRKTSANEITDSLKEQIVKDYVSNIKATADVKFINEADKFELSVSEPTAAAPAIEPETTAEVRADANISKPLQTAKDNNLPAVKTNWHSAADPNAKAIVDIRYAKEVGAPTNGRYMFKTFFRETGGKSGFKLTARDFYIMDPNGEKWSNSWSETVEVQAGGVGEADYWCDWSDHWAGGDFHCVWVGKDQAGNYISIVQIVRLLR